MAADDAGADGREESALRFVPAVGHEPAPNRLVVYDWFTRLGSPPRAGNRVDVLVDGEETWARTATDLREAQSEVRVTTWVCRPAIELERPLALATTDPEARRGLRFADHVEALVARGVSVRVLIWGLSRTPILDPWLRRWHWRGGPRLGVLEQDHVLLLGSQHQKTVTIDGRVGYCGGMNLKENDWDTSAHAVFDPRRQPHGLSGKRRLLVAAKARKPAFPPRHDFAVRIEGPAVADLEDNFCSRWNVSARERLRTWIGRIAERLRRRGGNAPLGAVPPPPPPAPPVGDVLLQVVRTSPDGEHGIFDIYRRALRNARRYVYIENQYFRTAMLAEELAAAMARNPHLQVVVVVPAIEGRARALLDPAAYWMGRMQETVRRVRPDFRLTQLLVTDLDARGRRVWQRVDVHAKVMIVDDCFLTVGSANLNDRSFRFDAEMNVVVHDRKVATDLRLRLMAEHLEVPPDRAAEVLADPDRAFALWHEHASENPIRRTAGEAPRSRVHAFLQPTDGEPLEVVDPPFGVASEIV